MGGLMGDDAEEDELQQQQHRNWEDGDDTPQQETVEVPHYHHRSSRGGSQDGSETPPPPSLSTPSIISSAAFSPALSPFKGEPSPSRASTLADDASHHVPSAGRIALARRLSLLAQQLAGDEDGLDEHDLNSQVDQMERALRKSPGTAQSESSPRPARHSSDHGSPSSSRGSGLSRSRYSELSAELLTDLGPQPSREPATKVVGVTSHRSRQIVAEVAKLNDELVAAVTNLKARQEESDHIHGLLIERAERAAQRILFLQSRISYLEQELQENDQELQHLRICLKAVELQMPPHPDSELQRCIATFKEEYLALKRKRADRQNAASIASIESTQVGEASPTR